MLLTYNLVRMVFELKEDYLLYQLSFSGSIIEITWLQITAAVGITQENAGRSMNAV